MRGRNWQSAHWASQARYISGGAKGLGAWKGCSQNSFIIWPQEEALWCYVLTEFNRRNKLCQLTVKKQQERNCKRRQNLTPMHASYGYTPMIPLSADSRLYSWSQISHRPQSSVHHFFAIIPNAPVSSGRMSVKLGHAVYALRNEPTVR